MNLSKRDKILLVLSELRNEKESVTVEDISVALWKKYPNEEFMKGYTQYPNNDIQKHFTQLFRKNYISGGVSSYRITELGINQLANLQNISKKSLNLTSSVKYEIKRLCSTRVLKHFKSKPEDTLTEPDFFEFIGTSPRSFKDKNSSKYPKRLNMITQTLDSIKNNRSLVSDSEQIIELWNILKEDYKKYIR